MLTLPLYRKSLTAAAKGIVAFLDFPARDGDSARLKAMLANILDLEHYTTDVGVEVTFNAGHTYSDALWSARIRIVAANFLGKL